MKELKTSKESKSSNQVERFKGKVNENHLSEMLYIHNKTFANLLQGNYSNQTVNNELLSWWFKK